MQPYGNSEAAHNYARQHGNAGVIDKHANSPGGDAYGDTGARVIQPAAHTWGNAAG